MAKNRTESTATAFVRTFAQVSDDQSRSTVWMLAVAMAVLAAWVCWAAWARVSLFEVSPEARVELDAAAYPVESPLEGRVVKSMLRVGPRVRSGDVLVEMDAVPNQLELQEERVREQGLRPELTRLQGQIAALEAAQLEDQQSARISAQEAENRVRESEIAAQASEQEYARSGKLYAEKLISDRDWEKATAETSRLQAVVATQRAAALRIPQDQIARDRERDVEVQHLRGNVAKLKAEGNADVAAVARLGYEVERRRVRAPIDGRIGEAAVLHVGAFLHQGEKLATIVPEGGLRVVAQYPAPAAFGRIRPGQTATLRLQGFPWAEFGTVSATVTSVAQEIRDGKVRVELAVDTNSNFRGQLQHGMPGELEITIERLSPLSLIARTAGQWLTGQP